MGGRLDLRRVAPARRLTRALAATAALAPGQELELCTADDPRPLLRDLHAAQPGCLDWAFLEERARRRRVLVARRRRSGPRSVTEYLGWDHRRLNGILAAVRRAAAAGALGAARRAFAEFACGLEHHIAMEERVLFPAFEHVIHRTKSPVETERATHASARGLMLALELALRRGDRARAAAAAAELVDDLRDHQAREVAILYTVSDRLAGGTDARRELVLRMRLHGLD